MERRPFVFRKLKVVAFEIFDQYDTTDRDEIPNIPIVISPDGLLIRVGEISNGYTKNRIPAPSDTWLLVKDYLDDMEAIRYLNTQSEVVDVEDYIKDDEFAVEVLCPSIYDSIYLYKVKSSDKNYRKYEVKVREKDDTDAE